MASVPTQRIDISTFTIAKFFLVPIMLWLAWMLRDILALLFLVLIIVAALVPAIRYLETQGVPRTGAVALLYATGVLFLIVLFSMIVPPLIVQVRAFVIDFPSIVSKVNPLYQLLVQNNGQQILNSLSSSLGNVTEGVFAATVSFFGGAAALVTALVLSFYLLVDARKASDSLLPLVPQAHREFVIELMQQTGEKLGAWLRGQLILSLIIGTIVFLGLSVLHVQFSLTLGVLAGLLEIIPFVGPVAAAFAAIFVAYASGTWQLALVVAAFYLVVQQLEGHILVPKVMESAVGLSPVIVVIALAIGAKLGGITGAILAVPAAAALSVVIRDVQKLRTGRRPA